MFGVDVLCLLPKFIKSYPSFLAILIDSIIRCKFPSKSKDHWSKLQVANLTVLIVYLVDLSGLGLFNERCYHVVTIFAEPLDRFWSRLYWLVV